MLCRNKAQRQGAQSTLEFTFAMVAVALLMMGMIRVFAWSGRDLRMRRISHDAVLTAPLSSRGVAAPLEQIRPVFFRGADLTTAAPSDIF